MVLSALLASVSMNRHYNHYASVMDTNMVLSICEREYKGRRQVADRCKWQKLRHGLSNHRRSPAACYG